MASNPVVLVTGASRGIGLAVTQILLSKFSAKVVAFQRSRPEELEALSKTYPDTLKIVQGDVASEAAITSAIQTAIQSYGRLDSLILNAGVLEPLSRIRDGPVSEWKEAFDVNFFSLVSTLQVALREATPSRVVFVSSGAATGAYAGWGAYAASKAAMNSLCRTLSKEEPGITCVALRPGMVDTAMQQAIRESESSEDHGVHPTDRQKFIDIHETGKLIKPEDPGYVIASLAVKVSEELSGQFLVWNGPELMPYRENVGHLGGNQK